MTEPNYTTVACIAAGVEVGARACVDRQREDRCFCPKAPLALFEVKKIVLPGSRLAETIAGCGATARAMLLKPADERYLGPALAAFKTGKPVERALAAPDPVRAVVVPAPAAPPKPAPPAPTPVHCEIPDCGKELRVNNLTGLCQEHRQQVPSRKRADLVPAIARSTGTAGDLLQRIDQPATPAKESSMGARGPSFSEGKKCRLCPTPIANINTTGTCKSHKDTKSAGPAAPRPPSPPRAPKPPRVPRTLADVAARHAPPSAPPADIVNLLERQLAHHREQAGKCERALAALRAGTFHASQPRRFTMAKNVKLGSVVRDRITGFQGIALARHEYLTGCNKITVQPQGLDKDGLPRKSEWFDEQTIEVLDAPRGGLVDEGEGVVGGPFDQPERSL